MTLPSRCLGINLDDDDVEGSRQHAVGFAFGAAHAWERFTVSPFCTNATASIERAKQGIPAAYCCDMLAHARALKDPSVPDCPSVHVHVDIVCRNVCRQARAVKHEQLCISCRVACVHSKCVSRDCKQRVYCRCSLPVLMGPCLPYVQ